MKSVVCTLFEGHYHHGVSALVNSLYNQGFRGDIYAGYRGELPSWANLGTKESIDDWKGSSSLYVEDGVFIHFLPLDTDYHFTNYKPDFMLRLWDGVAKDAEAMYYFDPDIVVVTAWNVFINWIHAGVALCEDVNSPLLQNHPKRIEWRNYFGKSDVDLKFKDSTYVNGGFIGMNKANITFLSIWKTIQELMAVRIGGLNCSALTNSAELPQIEQGDFAPFGKTDQDALNAAIEAWNGICTIMSKEAMSFRQGARLMSHALGTPKPWKWNVFSKTLNGNSPHLAVIDYWDYANSPIYSQPKTRVFRKKIIIKCCSLIGRFYHRR